MNTKDIHDVAEILKKNQAEPALLRAVVQELNLLTQRAADEADATPAVKKQYTVLLSDPEGRMPKHDFVAWVCQIPEEESPVTTTERINRASYEFNASKKGRLLPAKTVGEALECVPSKFLKEADLWCKTKTPVLVLVTNNEIPKEVREF